MGKTAWECYEARQTDVKDIFISTHFCQLRAKLGKQCTVYCKVILYGTGELRMENGKVSQTQVTPLWIYPQDKLSVAITGKFLFLFNSKLIYAMNICILHRARYDVLSIKVDEKWNLVLRSKLSLKLLISIASRRKENYRSGNINSLGCIVRKGECSASQGFI